jgi:hypothetical protein
MLHRLDQVEVDYAAASAAAAAATSISPAAAGHAARTRSPQSLSAVMKQEFQQQQHMPIGHPSANESKTPMRAASLEFISISQHQQQQYASARKRHPPTPSLHQPCDWLHMRLRLLFFVSALYTLRHIVTCAQVAPAGAQLRRQLAPAAAAARFARASGAGGRAAPFSSQLQPRALHLNS